MDFLIPTAQYVKKGKRDILEIFPSFKVRKSKDLMIRGGDFYAIWDDANKVWSTDEETAIRLIDEELDRYSKNFEDKEKHIKYMWNSKTKMIDEWHHYTQHQMQDNYVPLDDKLIFLNTDVKREDYSSKHLPYPLEKGDISAYDELMSVLYSEEERKKIEWAIGSIVTGDSKHIQKFMVFIGDAGTGKSTVMKIIRMLFEGYCATIDAKAIGSSQAAFALEPLKKNPLVAMQDDADLSKIQDNTRLNSLISHEYLSVNEKFKSPYETAYHCFIFLGSNDDVNMTDARSGLQRRLIDVRPTNKTLPIERYLEIMNQIKFELGAIAYHCKEVYLSNKHAYDKYRPTQTLRNTNIFYNFMEENYMEFKNGVSLSEAWAEYKKFCDESGITIRMTKMQVKKELSAYYGRFISDGRINNEHVRNYYCDIRKSKFGLENTEVESNQKSWLYFEEQKSLFDETHKDCKAQLANDSGTPAKKWDNVKTKLSDIPTSSLHYVKIPDNEIVIDFDIKDSNGNKDFNRNLEAASLWPKTYAELSKSEEGIHLHYIYDGDVEELSRIYSDDIEVKIFNGNSSLRRKLTKCNDIPIATINSGLPLKGEKNMLSQDTIISAKTIRARIKKCLNKEHHGATAPEVSFILKILDDAYNSGVTYDVTDMRPAILAFAANSTHQASNCLSMVAKMHFCSEDAENVEDVSDSPIIFYDVEVFPNLFICNWKYEDTDTEKKSVVRMINPTGKDIEDLLKYKLVGFNNRRYDNHILYARMQGYSNEELYRLSQRIVNGSSNAMFKEAYNLSYTDVYDFCSTKQSLKKWEIELGIHHQELGLKWDEPVPEDLWTKVAEYCDNDVIATEAVFKNRKADWVARQILAELSGLTVNDTTNQHTTKLIVGNDPHPQDKFIYTDLSTIFPGYIFEKGKSHYRGEDIGEGGYVYAEPGMYTNTPSFDVAGMHPASIRRLKIFGEEYTKNFGDIVDARLAIKHKDYESAGKMFGGKLAKYLGDDDMAKSLAYALKIAVNSVYGLTAAKFDNKLRDPRNIDNIVAKYGELFMVNLKHEVQDRGFTVAHIKTDSIKVVNPTLDIAKFIVDYGKQYGFTFEVEAEYEKICLVNDAVYIAKEKSEGWTATGAQFAQPYVFKKLFSKEPIRFEDMCETKTVNTSLYLDMNEDLISGFEHSKMECEQRLSVILSDKVSNKEEISYLKERIKELDSKIDSTHNYIFVGKAGSFCPIKPGFGGGILLREKDGKYYAATGSKGYRWMESENVKMLKLEDKIDTSYYEKLCNDAIDDISKFGDYYWFVSDDKEVSVYDNSLTF